MNSNILNDKSDGLEDPSGLRDNVDDIAPKDSVSNANSYSSSELRKVRDSLIQLLQYSGMAAKTVIKVETPSRKRGVFNVSSIPTLDSLLELLSNAPTLGLNAPAKKLFWKSGGRLWPVHDISLLVHDSLYIVYSELDVIPVLSPQASVPTSPETKSFACMDDFYKELQKAEELDKEEIDIIQDIFDRNRMKVKYLPNITDDMLIECGMEEGGLREAVLLFLGKL
ncbi:hypothetical protein MP638_001213 [Amoeboaphelidium occidentale]|nr:hypothetical protein MP638_001213 [Amoeboaphelidium occidentale]